MADPTGLAAAIARAYQAKMNNDGSQAGTCPTCGQSLSESNPEPSPEEQLQAGVDKDVLKK